MLQKTNVYVIDELDGTASFNSGHHEWCVSIAYLEKMKHMAGAVYAPMIANGTLYYGSKGEGAFIETNRKAMKCNVTKTSELNNAYVILGYDCFLPKYQVHNKLLTMVGEEARTVTTSPCALALGLLAAGKVDAVIQPQQSPWDWAAGKVLVEEAGGKMIFYEMENGFVNLIDRIEPKHYNPDKRLLGFVAANDRLTDQIMEMLMEADSYCKKKA